MSGISPHHATVLQFGVSNISGSPTSGGMIVDGGSTAESRGNIPSVMLPGNTSSLVVPRGGKSRYLILSLCLAMWLSITSRFGAGSMWCFMETSSLFVPSVGWILVTCAHVVCTSWWLIACSMRGLATSCWLSTADSVFVTPCWSSSKPHLSSAEVLPLRWSAELISCLLSGLRQHGIWYSRVGSAKDSVMVMGPSLLRELDSSMVWPARLMLPRYLAASLSSLLC